MDRRPQALIIIDAHRSASLSRYRPRSAFPPITDLGVPKNDTFRMSAVEIRNHDLE
jgi:hypothetical protein